MDDPEEILSVTDKNLKCISIADECLIYAHAPETVLQSGKYRVAG